MKYRLIILILPLILPLILVSCGWSGGTDRAEFEVERFHTLYNAEKYHEIYRRSHKEFQNFVDQEQMGGLLEKLAQNLGQFESASLISWKANNSFSGGTKITLTYNATYQYAENVKEIFTFQGDQQSMQLYNFNMSSPRLLEKKENATEI